MSVDNATSVGRCPIRRTDRDRERLVLETEGQPILDLAEEDLSYSSYVGVQALLGAAEPLTKAEAEPAYLLMAQVMELLFKLAWLKARRARDQLADDDLAGALWTLRRLRRVQSVLAASWDVPAALTPSEYLELRDDLGEASGVQSTMYRRLEFLLGNKDHMMVSLHGGREQMPSELLEALREPSLYDAALGMLRRRSIPLPADIVDRDWSRQYEERADVLEAWRVVYRDRRGHFDLYQLAEALVDVAYDYGRWRSIHLLTVERVLGAKVGTGGTHGVHWLRQAAEHRFFPELWLVRSEL